MTDHRADVGTLAAALLVVLVAVLGGGFTPPQKLVIGALLTGVWALAAVGWRGRFQRFEVVVLGLIGWAGVSAVLVGAAPLKSKETIVAWVMALGLLSISRRGGSSSRMIGARVLVLGAVAVAMAVLSTAVAAGSVRVGGPFENPNVAAAFLVPVLPLGLVVFRGLSWLRWGCFGLIIVAVVLTGSRAGLLAALVVIAIELPRGRIRIMGVAAGCSLAVGVLLWRFLSVPDLLAWHRISIWWATLKIWATRPLTGVGPGCLVEAAGPERILYPDQVGRYQFVIGFSESTPLAILVQLGLVGCVLAALATGLWLVGAHRSGAFGSPVFRATAAAVLTLCLFHDFLTVEPVLWWWAVVLGCCETLSRRDSVTREETPAASLRLAGALAMIWLTGWGIASPALARSVFLTGPPTNEAAYRVLRIEPWYPEPAGSRVRVLLARPDGWSWETAGEALHWASRAVELHPGLARRWADLGRVRTRILTDLGGTVRDEEAARDALARACALDPHLPWHWLERARLERVLGSHDDSVRMARRALDEEPNTVRAWLILSRLELERGRVDAAQSAVMEALTRSALIDRPGLTGYERELLALDRPRLDELRRALGVDDE